MKDGTNKAWSWIDGHRDDIVSLLSDLVKIPSINSYFDDDPKYMHEGDVQRYLEKFLMDMGMETEMSTPNPAELKKYEGKPGYYADHKFEDRPNLYGVLKGTGGGKSIMLNGHVDVVTRGGEWEHDPFSSDIVDGELYGRGSVDMKGGIAAMTMAIKAIKESGIELPGDIKFSTVVDEEAGGMGTLAFVDRGYTADACIITEPTAMKIAPLCRGILWGKLHIPCRAGHIEKVREPWQEGGPVDAINRARIFLKNFKILNNEWKFTRTHPLLPMPCQILVAEMHGGGYASAYAGDCTLTFNAQYLPSEKDENGLGSKLKKEIEDFVVKVAAMDPWMSENPPYIEWVVDADCFEVPLDHPFMKSIRSTLDSTGLDTTIEGLGCHTDMGFFASRGIPTINLGPGEPYICHQLNEHINLDEVIRCTKLLASIIMDWCSEKGEV